jgi:hypothetical protein
MTKSESTNWQKPWHSRFSFSLLGVVLELASTAGERSKADRLSDRSRQEKGKKTVPWVCLLVLEEVLVEREDQTAAGRPDSQAPEWFPERGSQQRWARDANWLDSSRRIRR